MNRSELCMCINGRMVCWSTHLVVRAADVSTLFHVVLFPNVAVDGVLEFHSAGDDIEVLLNHDTSIRAFNFSCEVLEVFFAPRYRQHPSFVAKSLQLAMKHLSHHHEDFQLDSGMKINSKIDENLAELSYRPPPRIGAIGRDELTQLIAREMGFHRSSSLDACCWLSFTPEISTFSSKEEDGCYCVAKKGGSSSSSSSSSSFAPQAIGRFATTPHNGEKLSSNSSSSGSNNKRKKSSSTGCASADLGNASSLLSTLPQRNMCIDELVRLASCDGLLWRSSAASFSTMMRYFQKSKSDFSWTSNEESKTIIRAMEAV